ncbi:uncharacterized protein LOC129288879 [Prosopis cineraria]|uniref:uncharacterized protein LOC129288879 n=1 Tax=Prosopis cineraria TaxID=364024 RepID=UPI00240FF184|nr:uncharacterized protein LOC129288879 [Prosopis cineraria]
MPIASPNHHLPPPSPIPRARGSRSAADPRFADYLDNTLHCPELALPPVSHMLVPAEIEYRSLSARMDAVVRSVKEFGAFRIKGHGITAQELAKMEEEAQEAAAPNAGRVIPCVHCRQGTLQFIASKSFGLHSHPNFWIPMGRVASRLDSIVEQVSAALQQLKQDTESVISLCRHPHGNVSESDDTDDERWCDYALRFYLPLQQCIFYVQSGRGPLSFDAGPDTIVVTVGRQLQEWSCGQIKSVAAEMIFMSGFQSKQAALSVELKLFRSLNKSHKMLSLSDQILILLCLSFLYNFLLLLFSS